ncbi:serine/threonine protein kinase [Roseimaritima multifibrata]|nr:serine/threonine-protein kinase [Roseimaritima multifibrata]
MDPSTQPSSSADDPGPDSEPDREIAASSETESTKPVLPRLSPALPADTSTEEIPGQDLTPPDQGSAADLPIDDLVAAKTVIRKANGDGQSPLAGHTPAQIASVLLGYHLNHFQLNSLIGGGGMGAVFSAHDTRLDRTVAIKVIPRVGEDPDLLRRFRNEAQSAAKLDHPNIARVYDVGRHDEWHYIVFEFIEGTNVRDLVNRHGVLSIDEAVYFVRQVAEALEHAHLRGVVHRDIKPSNVLIRPDGQVKVVDMGLARTLQLEVSGDMTASGVTLGTFDYISPEQARDPRDADVRSDIYSLGCTLYFMLTGSPPYPGGTVLQKLLSHGNSPPPDPRDVRPEVSDDLVSILHKMLAKRPGDRYRRPIDLISDLAELARRENLTRSQGLSTVAISTGSSWLARLERHLPWITAAVLLVLSVAWLQLLSSVSAVDDSMPRPTSMASEPTRMASLRPKETNQPATDLLRKPSNMGEDLLATKPLVGPPAPSSSDEATQPPSIQQIPLPPGIVPETTRLEENLPSGAAMSSTISELTATRIRVGGISATTPDELRTNDLATALALANEHKIARIELAERLIVTEPLVIEQNNLVIAASDPGCQIQFENSPLLAMEHAVMVDIGSQRVRFENLQFVWKVPSNAVHGGALFRIAANRGVQFENCAITIENTFLRDPINAFWITPVPTSSEDQQTVSAASPPLVAIELLNVIVRGEMTLIRMDVAAQLQFRWENGLAAISQRLLETGGAITKPPAGRTQLKLVLKQITASLPTGLAQVNLGPSGSIPVVLDRVCTNSVFKTAPGFSHIEINGLSNLQDGPFVLLGGIGNHYDSGPGNSDQMVRLNDQADDSVLFRLSDLATNTPPAWMKEQAPQSIIHWSQPSPPSEKPLHLLTPEDFLQDGTVLPGFDIGLLPTLLPSATTPPDDPT